MQIDDIFKVIHRHIIKIIYIIQGIM
jgi:hypothetical protein